MFLCNFLPPSICIPNPIHFLLFNLVNEFDVLFEGLIFFGFLILMGFYTIPFYMIFREYSVVQNPAASSKPVIHYEKRTVQTFSPMPSPSFARFGY